MNGGSETTNDASATGIGNEDSIHQVNTTARQDIVKFQSTLTSDYGETGTPRTMAHGMGTKPDWVITRSRDGGSYVHWNVWHQGINQIQHIKIINFLVYKITGASNNAGWSRTDTGFSTTVFTHPRYQYVENSKNYINYLWTELEGYSKFGGYERQWK